MSSQICNNRGTCIPNPCEGRSPEQQLRVSPGLPPERCVPAPPRMTPGTCVCPHGPLLRPTPALQRGKLPDPVSRWCSHIPIQTSHTRTLEIILTCTCTRFLHIYHPRIPPITPVHGYTHSHTSLTQMTHTHTYILAHTQSHLYIHTSHTVCALTHTNVSHTHTSHLCTQKHNALHIHTHLIPHRPSYTCSQAPSHPLTRTHSHTHSHICTRTHTLTHCLCSGKQD